MKKVIVLLVLLGSFASPALYSQSVLESAKKAGKVSDILPISNVAQTASGIVAVLKQKLSLNETQSPKVLEAVNTFLTAKSGIIDSAKTNPAGYLSQFGEIKDRLMSTLKTALTATQFKTLLALKPKNSSSSNVLSHLFY
jgi:hypothetical protein